MFDTPILFLIWNRKKVAEKVFQRIREIKPRILYVAADGPRKNVPGDYQRCSETRAIIDKIDWDCRLHKLYRSENLGLKKSVTQSISWFFKNNKEGIILEDDCLPDKSFFNFCSDMLSKYRNDKRIMHISGDNFSDPSTWNAKSYFFSKYPHIWGWASWRRVWKTYDPDMKGWLRKKDNTKLINLPGGLVEQVYWRIIFDAVSRNKINTWDYQWIYNIWDQGGYSIIPGVNLVSNLGFGPDAVHTKSKDVNLSCKKTQRIESNLKKPDFRINQNNDRYVSRNVFRINLFSVLLRSIYYRFF